jgi:hypothetical protein
MSWQHCLALFRSRRELAPLLQVCGAILNYPVTGMDFSHAAQYRRGFEYVNNRHCTRSFLLLNVTNVPV